MSELLTNGFNLLLVGMGSVFVFLAILVIAVTAMSRVVVWIEARYDVCAPAQPHGLRVSADTELVAVISVAIARYRSALRKSK